MIAVKAALIYRLASFVTWPKNTFDKKDDPIKITILGNRALYEGFDKDNKEKNLKIGRHKIEIKFAASPADIKDAHVVFVSASQSAAYFSANPETEMGIFTIGDSENFVQEGGMIQISIKNDKAALTANVKATSRGKIRVDAQVLENCEIYREP
jgi:hypothetical protein